MNYGSQESPKIPLLREILFLCLVSAIPLWLFGLAAEAEMEGQMRKIREENISLLHERFREVIHCEVSGIFLEYFARMFERSLASSSQGDFLRLEFDLLKDRYPRSFEVIVFDPDGRVIASLSDRPEAQASLEEFARDYRELASRNISEFNRKLPRYRGILGPCVGAYFENQLGGKISRAFFTSERAIVGIHGNFSGTHSFIYWFTIPPGLDIREAAFRFFLFRMRGLGSEFLRGIIDLDQPGESWRESFGEATSQLPLILGRPATEEGKPIFLGGYQWCSVPINPRKMFLFALPDFAGQFYRRGQFRLWGGIILGILGVFLLRFGIFRQRYEEFSLRSKLLFLFLYTGGIPMFLLLTSAQGMFHERRQTMEKRIFQEHVEFLKEFDRTYIEYLGLIEEVAKRNSRKSWAITPDLRDRITGFFRSTSGFVNCTWGLIFDRNGKELFHFSHDKMDSQIQHIAPLLGLQIAKRTIEIEQSDFSPQESAREQAIRATAESMGIDLDEMGAMRERFPGSFVALKVGSGRPLLGLDMKLRDVRGKMLAMGFLFWNGHDLANLFLRKRSKLFMKKLPRIAFGFREGSLNKLLPSQVPEEIWEKLRLALEKNPALPIQQKMWHEGKTFYLTAWNGNEVKIPFFALSDDEEVRTEIRGIAFRLAGTGLLVLCLGFGIAMMIFKNFLSPIDTITHGMDAMRNRNFASRVHVNSTDEFGQVAMAFNSAMEGMADLEIAKIVQDTFFPQTPLRENGWEVYGSSVSASKVGGDYFDYFALMDGRWLILIGDVAGHGVGASLVVAMAKALAFHNANKGSPSAILEEIDLCMQKTLVTRRFMTCFLAVFDPRTGLFISSNAGHNYPYLIGKNDSTEIKGCNSVLGVKKRQPLQDQSRVLENTDAVVFYTDGLVEALDREGNQIGYEKFRKIFPRLLKPDSKSSVASLREQFNLFAAPGPLADDVTILVLQRSTDMPVSPLL